MQRAEREELEGGVVKESKRGSLTLSTGDAGT